MILLRATQWCNQILILMLSGKIMAFFKFEIAFACADVFFCLYLLKLHSGSNFFTKKRNLIPAKKEYAVRPAVH